MSRIATVWAGLGVAILWTGCASPDSARSYFSGQRSKANIYVASGPSDVARVAIMPLKAPTELIGSSVSDLLVTELLRAGRYDLVERSQMSQVLNEAEIALSGLTEARAIELGNMLGAEGVIIGTVDEYGMVARRGRTQPVVGLSIRLIDCRSGKVLWSADSAERADSDSVSLSLHARKVVHGIVSGLYQKWHVQPMIRPARGREPMLASGGGSDAPEPMAMPARSAKPARVAPPPAPPPPTPEGFGVSDLGMRQVDLRWTPPAAAVGLKVRVERGESPEGPFHLLATVSAGSGTYSDREKLKDSTTYYYRLSAVAASGRDSAPTEVLESLTAPPPAQVEGVAAESGGVGIIPLSWTASPEPGVVEYSVCRATAADGPYERVARVRGRENTRHVDGGREPGTLEHGTTYHYHVLAVNSVGSTSEASAVGVATTRGPPPAVTGLAAESGHPREISLQWKESSDDKVAAYEIHRARGEGKFSRVAVVRGRDRVTYLDRGGEEQRSRLGKLEDGAEYRYQVVAVNIGNVPGAPSEPVSATTKPTPAAPSGLNARSAEPRKSTLEWMANPEPDIQEYQVEYRMKERSRFQSAGSAPGEAEEGMVRKVVPNLEDGQEYLFRVRAVDADTLIGAWSEEVRAVTKPRPPAPDTLRAVWEGAEALLTWNPPAVSDIVTYKIWRTGLIRSAVLGEAEAPEFKIDAARVGRGITVEVSAVDADGLESDRSAELTLPPPPPAPAPKAPPPDEAVEEGSPTEGT
ncbi:MAG: fibronectin type III domain-containing protein [Kiritimatiellae bacterium]|nr:fibronectin type III domain-containing protein [Kiritimatiellia bacterium]